jgi:hypothetical protein
LIGSDTPEGISAHHFAFRDSIVGRIPVARALRRVIRFSKIVAASVPVVSAACRLTRLAHTRGIGFNLQVFLEEKSGISCESMFSMRETRHFLFEKFGISATIQQNY